jgi:hypothetical protein
MSTIPTNIRMPERLHALAVQAADRMDIPIADVLRLAIAFGLKDIELLNFNVDDPLYKAVLKRKSEVTEIKVADEPKVYRESEI